MDGPFDNCSKVFREGNETGVFGSVMGSRKGAFQDSLLNVSQCCRYLFRCLYRSHWRSVVGWAMNVAGIPPSRIIIFAQSMDNAMSTAVSKYLALQDPPSILEGTVLIAPFVDVATLSQPTVWLAHNITSCEISIAVQLLAGTSYEDLEQTKLHTKLDLGCG